MRILGIDPGYAIVGFGIIEIDNLGGYKVIDYGIIETHKGEAFSQRLKKIYDGVNFLIDKYIPDEMAIEELFFNNNITTAIAVAQARGVCVLAGVNKLKKVSEYTPLQIKQALTGNGRADKKQVQFMVKSILGLDSVPKPDDAADAVAVALCHSQTNSNLIDNSF